MLLIEPIFIQLKIHNGKRNSERKSHSFSWHGVINIVNNISLSLCQSGRTFLAVGSPVLKLSLLRGQLDNYAFLIQVEKF